MIDSDFDNELLNMDSEDRQTRRNISGLRIRDARRELGLSQGELSQRLEDAGLPLSQGLISRVEIGTRVVPDYELKYFAMVFEKPVHWFLQDD